MRNVIEIEGLRKTYRRRRGATVAVDGLDLAVPEGGVFGFLGPNGSGKTTTIRCVLGLARPTSGNIALLRCPVPSGLRPAMSRVGAIVETPAMFPTLSARDNLRLLAGIDGIDAPRIETALDSVGLTDRAGDHVRKFSLGMRQRLALAAALMKDPEVLILDEPANGLDPAGMRDVREILRRLADQGRTVFLSSHILAEIEQTCDRVAIVTAGRCVAQGTVDDVLVAAGSRPALFARVGDVCAGQRALMAAGFPVRLADRGLVVEVDADRAESVSRVLADAGQWVTELRAERTSLEDSFLALTAPEEVGV